MHCVDVERCNLDVTTLLKGVVKVLVKIVVIIIRFLLIGTILVPHVVGGDFRNRPRFWYGRSASGEAFSTLPLDVSGLTTIPTIINFLSRGVWRAIPIGMRRRSLRSSCGGKSAAAGATPSDKV
jgi:hypothetical protein